MLRKKYDALKGSHVKVQALTMMRHTDFEHRPPNLV